MGLSCGPQLQTYSRGISQQPIELRTSKPKGVFLTACPKVSTSFKNLKHFQTKKCKPRSIFKLKRTVVFREGPKGPLLRATCFMLKLQIQNLFFHLSIKTKRERGWDFRVAPKSYQAALDGKKSCFVPLSDSMSFNF